jgi:hypothetical protein
MKVRCPQCQGEVALAEASSVARCRHCDSSLHVDLGGMRLHRTLAIELDERAARRALGLYRSGFAARLAYYPFWAFDRGPSGRMAPADSDLVEACGEVPVPGGREGWFHLDAGASRLARPPDIPLAAVLGDEAGAEARARLLHVPFWVFEQAPERALVDAVSGQLRSEPAGAAAPSAGPSSPLRRLLPVAFFLAALLPGAAGPAAFAGVGLAGWLLLAREGRS